MFTINNIVFVTKTSAEQYVQELVARHSNCVPITGDDAAFVEALFDMHPAAGEKRAGRRVTHFEVQTYRYGTRALFAVFEDGTAMDFSWRKSVGVKAA